MKILAALIIIIFTIGLFISILILLRNSKVCEFRIYLVNKGNDVLTEFINSKSWNKGRYDELYEIWRSIMEDTTYNEMLYSFKPLDVEHWLTEKQQDFLNLKFGENE